MSINTKDLDPNSRDELVASVMGEVLFQEDKKFEDARTAVWNLDSAGMPAVIIKCKNANDVAAAIKFAKTNNVRICVHTAGAHSGHAVVDNCVTIDLSLLRSVSVDASSRQAIVAGGATIGDVDSACKPYGLALPMGHVHHTGVAGMALNATSGVGFLCRSRNLTATFLKGVTLVMSDGSVKEVNESENSDLFWGMRGAGANFGIAVKMVFSLTSVAPSIYGGDVIKFGRGTGPGAIVCCLNSDKTRNEIVMKWFEHFQNAPKEAYSLLVIAPKGPVVTRLCYIPSEDDTNKPKKLIKKEACDYFRPFTSFGKTLVKSTKMMNYWDGLQKLGQFDRSYYYQKASMVDIPSKDLSNVVDQFCTFADTCPVTNVGSGILVMPLGGNLQELDPSFSPTADVLSKMKWWIIVITEFPEGPASPQLRKECMEWTRDVYQVIEPYCAVDSGREKDYWAETIGSIYGNNVSRLRDLKEKYDPENVFSMNKNISPNKTVS